VPLRRLRLDLGYDRFMAAEEKSAFELISIDKAPDGTVRRSSLVTNDESPVPPALKGMFGKTKCVARRCVTAPPSRAHPCAIFSRNDTCRF
jgi:hypothetical protein